MDDQHGILMDTINELQVALARGCNQELVTAQLHQLVDFTGMHFWSEEQLMEQHGFPNLSEHRAEHRRLLGKIRESAHRAQRAGDSQVRPLLSFLCDWFMEHFEGPDREYGPWLNERGVY
jgi:hemerythrin-like metal-binding protein